MPFSLRALLQQGPNHVKTLRSEVRVPAVLTLLEGIEACTPYLAKNALLEEVEAAVHLAGGTRTKRLLDLGLKTVTGQKETTPVTHT